MREIAEYIDEYNKYHQTKGNRYCHFVGIPLIVIAIFGMLDYAVLASNFAFNSPLTLAMILFTIGNVFYLKLHTKLGITMVVSTLACYLIGSKLTFWMNGILFIVGWIFQLYGHKKFEHKAPAFLDNFVHLLIGPLFIQNEILRMIDAEKNVEKKV